MEKEKMKHVKGRIGFFLLLLACFVIFSGQTINPTVFHFVAMGDNGCACKGQQAVATKMIEWRKDHPYDTVIMMGDNVYPMGMKRGGNKDLFEAAFDQYYKPLTMAGVKFYATVGNHDTEADGAKAEIADQGRFHILGQYGYYSFASNEQVNSNPLVMFFCINSTRLLKLGADDAQIAWLSKSLTESKALWKIAYFHHPIYGPSGGHKAEKELKQGIEKILQAGGAQIVLSGHNHYYARLKPENGITYFVTGGGGQDLYTPKPTPETVTYAKQYHFIYFDVYPEKTNFIVIPPSGPALDQGTILRAEKETKH
ncbi:MAG: hypothetical protein C5B54_11965 [Acidobacteria bacterium]|nr:MAG: hypothetical protein C5B54_11965 [Acidobacteriota bacterium]